MLVTGLAGSLDDSLRQLPAKPSAPELGANVQPLHLAQPWGQLSEGHAPGHVLAVEGDEQATVRGRVISGQIRKLAVEVLEAQVDAKPSGVFREQPPGLRYILFRFGSDEPQLALRHSKS